MDDPKIRAAYADASRTRLGETVGRLRTVAAEVGEKHQRAAAMSLRKNIARLEGRLRPSDSTSWHGAFAARYLENVLLPANLPPKPIPIPLVCTMDVSDPETHKTSCPACALGDSRICRACAGTGLMESPPPRWALRAWGNDAAATALKKHLLESICGNCHGTGLTSLE